MRDQLVTETIDARILRLVGLEQAFDLDYETYLILLKEAQVKGKNTLAPEEQAILANERKRVRGKVGRFKPKSKTIRVDNITSVGRVSQKVLPGTKGIGSALIVKSLENISKTVESISDNLSDQSKEDKKEAEENRKDEENKKRRKKEESLETSTKKIVSAAKKLFAPVKGILDSIYNYLFYTFLGRGVNEALTWLSNPENKNKVAALGKFVSDFWPALLGAATYFFTPLRGFINGIVGLVVKLGKFFIKGPKSLDPVSLGVGVAVSTFEAERRKQQEEKRLSEEEAKKRGVKPETVQKELKESKKSWWSMFGQGFSDVGLSVGGIAGGGFIDQSTGLKISGAGPDTQLTALQPGEVVMNRATVRAVGAGNLLNLNRMFGGPNANKPRFANNIQLSRFGGMVGRGLRGADLMRIMHGTSSNAAESIRSSGFREQTGMLGKGVYGSLKGWVADTYRGAGKFKGVLPGQGPRLDMLVPQTARTLRGATVVSSRQANRGLSIAEGILSGKYTGPKAQSLMPLLTRSTPTMRQAITVGVRNFLGRAMGVLNAPIVGDMLDPRGAGGGSTLQEAYKRGYYKGPMPGPLTKGSMNIITLPPSIENVSSSTPPRAGGSEIPSFSAIAPGNRRMENAQIYGIVP